MHVKKYGVSERLDLVFLAFAVYEEASAMYPADAAWCGLVLLDFMVHEESNAMYQADSASCGLELVVEWCSVYGTREAYKTSSEASSMTERINNCGTSPFKFKPFGRDSFA